MIKGIMLFCVMIIATILVTMKLIRDVEKEIDEIRKDNDYFINDNKKK
jgi:hypothetical protein